MDNDAHCLGYTSTLQRFWRNYVRHHGNRYQHSQEQDEKNSNNGTTAVTTKANGTFTFAKWTKQRPASAKWEEAYW